MKILPFLLLLFLASFPVRATAVADQLKTDRRTNPLGFDNPVPELSWIITSGERGTFQKAYEILVSDDEEKLKAGIGNVWQSGMKESPQTFGIQYAGKPLVSFTRYYWKVRVWDQNG